MTPPRLPEDDVHTLPRLFVEGALAAQGDVALTSDQTHHLCTVLRRTQGQSLRVFNGRDGEWLCILELTAKRAATARIQSLVRPQPPPRPPVHLFFAPLPKDRMDFLVEKSVELGADALHPVITERTGVRQVNTARVTRQIVEAAEQCERMDMPVLHDPAPLLESLTDCAFPIFACVERGDHPPLPCNPQPGEIGILIGPEGGFSPRERDALLRLELVRPVALGPRILRAETAALCALSRLGASL
ncbi:MAG TPA: 16S rRNA (uracil(1498)-N(3))-methyltransferase [Alphaproteobacteria bacterium]|nr:16S rRNA (uracil(1498)-N(3))-methyltransferase [Alphaproteobacteria bacterium]